MKDEKLQTMLCCYLSLQVWSLTTVRARYSVLQSESFDSIRGQGTELKTS